MCVAGRQRRRRRRRRRGDVAKGEEEVVDSEGEDERRPRAKGRTRERGCVWLNRKGCRRNAARAGEAG